MSTDEQIEQSLRSFLTDCLTLVPVLEGGEGALASLPTASEVRDALTTAWTQTLQALEMESMPSDRRVIQLTTPALRNALLARTSERARGDGGEAPAEGSGETRDIETLMAASLREWQATGLVRLRPQLDPATFTALADHLVTSLRDEGDGKWAVDLELTSSSGASSVEVAEFVSFVSTLGGLMHADRVDVLELKSGSLFSRIRLWWKGGGREGITAHIKEAAKETLEALHSTVRQPTTERELKEAQTEKARAEAEKAKVDAQIEAAREGRESDSHEVDLRGKELAIAERELSLVERKIAILEKTLALQEKLAAAGREYLAENQVLLDLDQIGVLLLRGGEVQLLPPGERPGVGEGDHGAV